MEGATAVFHPEKKKMPSGTEIFPEISREIFSISQVIKKISRVMKPISGEMNPVT
jgi:hypothetical protein